jgi:hypothetical protein
MARRTRKGHLETSWEELEEELPNGENIALLVLGHNDDADAPRIVRSVLPPHTRIDVHTHNTDYVEIILQGSEMVGRTWYREGQIRRVHAGYVYGPLVAGPAGVSKLIVFRDGNWLPRQVQRDATQGLSVGPLAEQPGL